jgi:chromosome partitioning protein
MRPNNDSCTNADIIPTVRLAQELAQEGIKTSRIKILLSRVGGSEIELQETIDYLKQTSYEVIKEVLYEKTVYRRASDLGKSITESTHSSTNRKAALVVREIVNLVENNSIKEVA